MDQLVLELKARPEKKPPIRPEGRRRRELLALMADAILTVVSSKTESPKEDDDE